LIITLGICGIFELLANYANTIYLNNENEILTVFREADEQEDIEIMKKNSSKEIKETKEDLWQVEIPKIDLVAPISEGTSQEVMQEFVGHFADTSIWNGNVGLAAHNRGYPINYFSRLKEVKTGDKIIYKSEFGTKTYSVKTIKTIEDTDWSYLQKTKDNRITLITCVENEPSKRLCVQAVQIKEE